MISRKIRKVKRGSDQHWVGNGFPVRSIFAYDEDESISPFLLLDYAGPVAFDPSETPRSVDFHPHRGFETVTIVYHGEVAHRDTAGNSGLIGPGDVQWMTAGSGILHEEKHSAEFVRQGGKLQMLQLWVNLPSKEKMSSPRYQGLLSQDIPVMNLPDHKGLVRVIAGSFAGQAGSAKTFTPIHLFDVRLAAGAEVSIPVEDGFNTFLFVLSGKLQVSGEVVQDCEIAHFEPTGGPVLLRAETETILLFMSGAPINESIVGYGPFVMNTQAEIDQAIQDFRSGLFNSVTS